MYHTQEGAVALRCSISKLYMYLLVSDSTLMWVPMSMCVLTYELDLERQQHLCIEFDDLDFRIDTLYFFNPSNRPPNVLKKLLPCARHPTLYFAAY